LLGLALYVIWFFSLTAFNILSLFYVLIVLIIMYFGEVLFWSCLLVTWKLPIPEWTSLSWVLCNFLLWFCWI
jgi:hypothetical protein